MKRSLATDARGIPLDQVLAPANRHDSVLLAGTLDKVQEMTRSRMTSKSGSTPTTTRRRPATNSKAVACTGNRAQGRKDADPGRRALAGRADERLAQQLQPPPALLGAQGDRHRRVLRPRRPRHHAPSAHSRSMDPLPMGRPPRQTTLTNAPSVRSLNPARSRARRSHQPGPRHPAAAARASRRQRLRIAAAAGPPSRHIRC
jgi:hypothetical protein